MSKSFVFAALAVLFIAAAFAQGPDPAPQPPKPAPNPNPQPQPVAIPGPNVDPSPQPHPNPNPNPNPHPNPNPNPNPNPVTPEPAPVTPEPAPVTPEPVTPQPDVTPSQAEPVPEPAKPCTGELYGIFTCVDGVLIAEDVTIIADQLWSGDRYELKGNTVINATLTLEGADVVFWGDVNLNGRLNFGLSSGVTVNQTLAFGPSATLVINYTESTFTPLVVSGFLLVDGNLILDFDKAPMSPRVSIFTDSPTREGDFASSVAFVGGAAAPCLTVYFDDFENVVDVALTCVSPSPVGNETTPGPNPNPNPNPHPNPNPQPSPVIAPVIAPSTNEPHPAPNPNPEPAPEPHPVPATNVTDWSAAPMDQLLKHVNDTLRNLTIQELNDRISTNASVVVLDFRINVNLTSVEFLIDSDPKNSTKALIEALVNILKTVSNVTDSRLGDAKVIPPTAVPNPPGPVAPQPPAPQPVPPKPAPQPQPTSVVAPEPPKPAPEPLPTSVVAPEPPKPAPHPVPNPAPEMPAPEPAKERRAILDNVNDNENDWSESFFVRIQLVTPAAPAPPKGVPISLIVILGVITVVALIITIVLVVTLNRKKHDDYMPVEDLEDDRLLTDTY